jgi:hypothetical protein
MSTASYWQMTYLDSSSSLGREYLIGTNFYNLSTTIASTPAVYSSKAKIFFTSSPKFSET